MGVESSKVTFDFDPCWIVDPLQLAVQWLNRPFHRPLLAPPSLPLSVTFFSGTIQAPRTFFLALSGHSILDEPTEQPMST